MSEISKQEQLKLIEKQRYLIPCQCKICKSRFDDIILCQIHIFEEHPDRKNENIVDNMTWNVEADIRRYKILQELEGLRNRILKKLNDPREISESNIPSSIKIKNKEVNVNSFINSITNQDKDKKPSKDQIEEMTKSLYTSVEKYIERIIKDKMGREVDKMIKKKKLDITTIVDDLPTYLGVKKAIYQVFSRYPAIKSKIEKSKKSKLFFPIMKN